LGGSHDRERFNIEINGIVTAIQERLAEDVQPYHPANW
jgi:hypothetical protein